MIELPTIYVSESVEAWLDTICQKIKVITNQTDHHSGQTVVIICEDIMTVETMEEKLISSGTVPSHHVHLYSRSDRHEVEGLLLCHLTLLNVWSLIHVYLRIWQSS